MLITLSPNYLDFVSLRREEAIIREALIGVFTLVAVIADLLIIYILLRSERLRNIPNIFLANWAIADSFKILLIPTTARIFQDQTGNFLCVWMQANAAIMMASLLFMTIVAIDWALAAFYPSSSEKFRRLYLAIIALSWVLCVCSFSLFTGFCINRNSVSAAFYSVLVALVVFIIFIFTVQVVRLLKGYCNMSVTHPIFMLNVASIYGLCTLFGNLFTYFESQLFEFGPWLTMMVFECGFMLCPLVVLYMLMWSNDDFYMKFMSMIKCTCCIKRECKNEGYNSVDYQPNFVYGFESYS